MKNSFKKKVLATGLTAAMTVAAITGCSKGAEGGTGSQQQGAGAGAGDHSEEMTFEVYDVAANYQGEQTGWFGWVLKDRLNIKLNIIAPQVSGDASQLYQTRAASGNLGDIVLLDNADMQDCINSGLVMDIGDEIWNYPNLSKYKEQIEAFNANLEGASDGSVFAIPLEMNSNGPTDYVENTVSSMPRVRWDYYVEAGSPDLKTTDDLIDLLKTIQENHPTNDDGDKAYAITMWPDWDGTSIENVNQLTKWYGEEVNGSVLISGDNTIRPLTDKEGAYYKMLKFFYKAQAAGIVDPDSATQDWNSACDKMRATRVYLIWNNWMGGFTNTPANGEARKNYVPLPIEDMNVFQTSDSYYGDGRVIGIGSGVTPEEKTRILEFLDWYCSPDGLQTQHVGIKDVMYTVNADGKYELTEDGLNRFTADVQIPEEYGGGTFTDGNNNINQWIVAGIETNPETGETYSSDYWASYVELNTTATTKEWEERFGAKDEVDYLKTNDKADFVPWINMSLPSDDTDVALARSQCGKEICDASWRMVWATSEEEFDQMWDEMVTTLNGLGWESVVAFDTEKYQAVVDARIAAMK